LSHDGAREDLANFAEHVFRRDAELAISRRALEERLGSLLIEDTRVDGAAVQLDEREKRRERDAAIAAAKRSIGQQREKKRGDFVGERRIGFAAEGRDLRTLDGVDETELRFDDAGMRLRSAELGTHRAMEIDEILNGEVARRAAVSR